MALFSSFDIIVFLGQDWEKYHRQSMIKCLAQKIVGKGKLLCIERPICLITSPFRHSIKYLEWIAGKRSIRQINTNLFIFTPVVVIHDHIAPYLPYMVKLNKKILFYIIKKVTKQIGFEGKKRLSWLYDPLQIDYIGVAGENYLVYECLDTYAEFKSNPNTKRRINQKEALLVERADLVLTTGKIEYLAKYKLNPNTFYAPNGVDIPLFQKALDEKTQLPHDLSDVPRPWIGYIGNWASYCDTDLIIEIAQEKPLWSFIFIGSITLPTGEKLRLTKLPNIYFLGWKGYDLLPNYLKGFDLAIVPFIANQLTENADPLKTYEYMAAGCPIISTDIPQARQFAGLVKVIKNKTEFIAAAEDLLRSDNSHLKNQLVKEAYQHSWEGRIEQMLEIIKKTLVDSDRKR